MKPTASHAERQIAARRPRQLGVPAENFNYRPEPAPAITSPTDKIKVQQEIDHIYAENPPGSREYTRREVQNRLAMLFAMLAGEGPVVGKRLRVF